jgi:hypothetical protein
MVDIEAIIDDGLEEGGALRRAFPFRTAPPYFS